MVTSRAGIPVAVRVFAGNTSDWVAFGEIIPVVRDKFGLDEVILVGDRGSAAQVRIRQLQPLPGAGWITALRAPEVAALARAGGPLQMSLSGHPNFAEVTDARYPGERLICCRNPALAARRAATRESLLAASRKELEKIAAQAAAGRLKGADKIGVKVGKVINKNKVGKHFITDIADGRLSWRRDEDKIAAEAELDGIYVYRTSATEEILGTAGTVEACKDLGNLERDFWSMKAEDTGLRPIYHYLENRVGATCFVHARHLPYLAPAPGVRPAHFHRQQQTRPRRPGIPRPQIRHSNGERHRENNPGEAARPRLPRSNQPSGHPDQKHR